ncbi:MAG: hypothetical protein ABSG32_10805 [Terriglobia bacterium]|jgi:hypothetical protein
MRIRVLVAVVAALIGLAAPLKSETQPVAQNPLDQLAWMIGGTWTTEGDKGPDGKPFHVECTLRWTENHRGMKFTTWFLIDGKLVPVYEGLYAWHPAKKKFTFLYTDNEGNLTEGEATMTGDHLEQEFQIVEADGTARAFCSTIVRTGPDDHDWNVQHQNKDGEWVVVFGLKYQRKPA